MRFAKVPEWAHSELVPDRDRDARLPPLRRSRINAATSGLRGAGGVVESEGLGHRAGANRYAVAGDFLGDRSSRRASLQGFDGESSFGADDFGDEEDDDDLGKRPSFPLLYATSVR